MDNLDNPLVSVRNAEIKDMQRTGDKWELPPVQATLIYIRYPPLAYMDSGSCLSDQPEVIFKVRLKDWILN